MSDQSNRSMQQGANTAASAGRGAVRGGKAAYRAGKTAVKAGKAFIRLPAPVQIGIAIALVIVMFAAVIVGGTSSTSMDETWYLTAENAIDKDNEANSPKTEDELTSVESEYNSIEKTSKLAAIIHEVKEEDRTAIEEQLQKTYPDKSLTIECDTDTEEYYISDVFAINGSGADSSADASAAGTSTSANQQAINGALAWARKIAADDSWTYGHGSFECCICNKMKIKKFTCMPFVAAAYAHGGGDPIMMGKGRHVINLNDGNFKGNLGKIWKKIGLCKDLTTNDLRPGDVVIKWDNNNQDGHAWMYGGNDEIIEATGNGGIHVINGAAKRLKRYGKGSKNYVMRYVGQGDSSTTGSTSGAAATITSGGKSQSRQDVINGACAWAVAIANDNSFHYGACNTVHPGVKMRVKPKVNSGHKMCSHHNGCYFCKTNNARSFKWIVDKEKTYCCNPFVHAAFSHGGGEPTMLKLCKDGRSYGFATGEGYDTSKLFKKMGKISVSKLQKGDVLCTGSHAMLYIGNGKMAQAGSRDDNVKGSKSWNNSINVTKVYSSDYERVYRYIGNGGGIMELPSGASGTSRSASELPSYKSIHILGEIKQSDGKIKHLDRRGAYQIGQSFALTESGNFVVAWATQPSTTRVCASLYDENGKRLADQYVNGHHANSSTTSKDGEIWIGGWLSGNSDKVACLSVSGNSLSSAGTKELPARNSSGLAYDRQTGKYILGAGGTLRIYDSSLKTREKKIYKKHGDTYQDICAGGGIIYTCHSVKKGNMRNGSGENYVDLYRESDGAYLGSYKLNYGELESCVIKNGELILFIHVKGEGRCFIQWTGVNVLGGDGAAGFGFNSDALAGTTGISKSDLEILSAYSVSLANTELVFLKDAKQTTKDDAITGRYFNKLESKLGSSAGKPVKLYWFGKDRGKADYEGDLKRKLRGAVLYDREYEISESGDSIKITLKQRKAHEIMRDAFGLDANASYVNATTKMTATEITGSDSDSATGSISGSGSASSTQEGIQKSIEWARKIAADDRFTYGKGYGDYYDCPVCHGSTKKSELKYTCNPFVAAAFAHGTGDPLLMNHGKHKVRTSDWNFEGNRSKIWKKVGLCKNLSWSDIQPGDIFINYASGVGGHACIYGGGDELIEATSGSGITDKKSGAKKRFKSYQKGNKNFVMRYIGSGSGASTSSSGSAAASVNGWTGKSSNGKCYLGNAASPKNMSQSGDQDGKEVLVSKCGTDWDYVIRWNDASKALAASKIMYDACKNDHVGYNNQNKAKSTSFYKQLVANKGDASAISENCDTACAQMVAAILRYLGVDMNDYVDSKGLYNTLKKKSEFTVYSSKDYTKSTSNLRPGDILLRVNGNNHTAMVVQTKDGMEGVEAITSGDGEVYTGLTGGTATNGEAGYTLAENTAQLLFNGRSESRTITMGSGSSMQDVVFGGYSNGGELTFPLPKGTWTFTSDRGFRWGKMHEGVDLGAGKGTPIYAAAAGTVVRSEYFSGYGNCIDIDHGGGMITRYGHQSKLIAKKGDTVQAGQKIGEVGNTGHSFGNHLHFEVRINGKSVDPKPYIGMSGMKPQ